MSYPVCVRPEFLRSKQPKNRPKADCLLLWSRRSSTRRLRTDKSTLLHDPFGEDDSRVGSVNVKEDRQQKLLQAALRTACNGSLRPTLNGRFGEDRPAAVDRMWPLLPTQHSGAADTLRTIPHA
jgi:hypothetical protein